MRATGHDRWPTSDRYRGRRRILRLDWMAHGASSARFRLKARRRIDCAKGARVLAGTHGQLCVSVTSIFSRQLFNQKSVMAAVAR